MKRIFALMLIACLLLCGCSETAPDESTETTQATEPVETTLPITQPTETVKPVVLFRHPLTGAPLEEAWSGQVTAVVVNNIKVALPQSGISQADILYEVEVEGDITRCMAVFTDLSAVKNIGSIRSARTYFNSLAVSYDAPLIHCGGSPGMALIGRYGATMDTIEGWQHIDQASYGQYFFRDMDRYSAGVPWEHTLFTTGEKLQKAIQDKGYYTPESRDYGLVFDDDVTIPGETANEVTVKFKSGKTTTFYYDTAANAYKMYQYGQDHVDGNTDEKVYFQNVIAIYTTQTYAPDGTHKFYESIGTGNGYAAINGKIVPIIWNRETLRDSYTYTLEDGTPLTMESGTTYIAMVGIKHDIAYK